MTSSLELRNTHSLRIWKENFAKGALDTPKAGTFYDGVTNLKAHLPLPRPTKLCAQTLRPLTQFGAKYGGSIHGLNSLLLPFASQTSENPHLG